MGKYPTEITEDVLAKNSHIDNATILQDIKDTEAEIVALEKEVRGYELIAEAQIGTPRGKLAAFRRDAKRQGLSERQDFICFLTRIFLAREKKGGNDGERG